MLHLFRGLARRKGRRNEAQRCSVSPKGAILFIFWVKDAYRCFAFNIRTSAEVLMAQDAVHLYSDSIEVRSRPLLGFLAPTPLVLLCKV